MESPRRSGSLASPSTLPACFPAPNRSSSARHRLLAPLCVKPSAQGRGVGTSLLRHLNDLVDASSPAVPVYLDASKAGQPVYLKEGFEYFGEEGRPFPGMVRWGKAERPAEG